MVFKDISGIVALIGVVFTAGIVFTKMSGDIDKLKGEVKRLSEVSPTTNGEFPRGNILLKVQDSTCPMGWEPLGKTAIIVHPGAKVNFEKYAEFREGRHGWPNIDFIMCAKT